MFALANIGSVIGALRYARIGGASLVVAGSLFSLFAIITAGRNHWLAALVSGGPFVLSGILFLVADRRPHTDDVTIALTPDSEARPSLDLVRFEFAM